MRRTVFFLLLLSVICGVSKPVRAQHELGISLTDTLTVEYRGDNENDNENDDNYGLGTNRFNLIGTYGDLTASLRVDSTLFIEPPTEGNEDDLARLERLTANYRLGDWELVAGDYVAQLGRGILLSIRSAPEVGLDVALRGGKLRFNSDDHDFSLFAGLTNPGNLDSISQYPVEDTNDIVVATEYEFRGLGALDFGAHGLYFEPSERILEERDLTAGGGLVVELNHLADWIRVYLEGDLQHRELAGTSELGKAGYVTIDLVFGDFTLLLEGLYLDAFELRGSSNTALSSRFDYTQPPTLERIDQEVINNRDVVGGRARAEYYIYPLDTVLYANGMYRINSLDEPNQLDQLHAYGGVEVFFQRGRSHVNLSSGYRDEHQGEQPIKSMVHAEVDYLQALSAGWSLHLTSTNEFRTLQDNDYQRGSAAVGVDLAATGGLTFEFGYDTQDLSGGVRNYFYAGILFWEISDAFQLRVTGGTQRGGIKCISGVCRDFPEFAGARAILVGRY